MLSVRAIYDRDRAICALCGLFVPWRFAGAPHPLAPTRDHIERVCEGGGDHAENLRLAHSKCNSNRESPSKHPDETRAFIEWMLTQEPAEVREQARSVVDPPWRGGQADNGTVDDRVVLRDRPRKRPLVLGCSLGKTLRLRGLSLTGGAVIERVPRAKRVHLPRVDSESPQEPLRAAA